MTFSQNDTNVLRDLATRCREIADSEQNLVLKQRWTDLNDLKHSGPPLLLTSPEGAWREIIPTFPVECEGPQARGWECALRKRIYQHDVIKDDAAFDPVFTVGRAVSVGDYGIPFSQSRSEEAQGAYHDEPVLTNLDSDLDKLHFRTLTVDREKSEATFELAAQTLGDLRSNVAGHQAVGPRELDDLDVRQFRRSASTHEVPFRRNAQLHHLFRTRGTARLQRQRRGRIGRSRLHDAAPFS